MNTLLKENLGQTFSEIAIKHQIAKPLRKSDLLKEFGFDLIHEEEKQKKKERKNIEIFKQIVPISEIKRVGIKYRLRLLPTNRYKGFIDDSLYVKMQEFKQLLTNQGVEFKKKNLYILAPGEMFETPRLLDPVLFYLCDKRNMYLIHQWGGEINRLRSIANFPLRTETSKLTSFMSVIVASIAIFALSVKYGNDNIVISSGILMLVSFFGSLIFFENTQASESQLNRDMWDIRNGW